jgi:hypothetical protein
MIARRPPMPACWSAGPLAGSVNTLGVHARSSAGRLREHRAGSPYLDDANPIDCFDAVPQRVRR